MLIDTSHWLVITDVTLTVMLLWCFFFYVEPYMAANGTGMFLQHDNARPHVARLVTQHLANENIQHLKWPFVSPDLSPIEHMWDELERRLRQRDNQPQSLQELSDALIEKTTACRN